MVSGLACNDSRRLITVLATRHLTILSTIDVDPHTSFWQSQNLSAIQNAAMHETPMAEEELRDIFRVSFHLSMPF